MVVWVWTAGTVRLKHLALMRVSAASRLFARTNLLLLSFALGALVWTRFGWIATGGRLARDAGDQARPGGSGWIHVSGAPHPLPDSWPLEAKTELWWNPAQAIISVVAGLILAILFSWIWSLLMRSGIRLAHTEAHRGEQRMGAALHYGTAWVIPLLLPCVVYSIMPLSFFGTVGRSTWIPQHEAFAVVSGAMGGVVLALWWFWLIRIAFSSPAVTRGRVVAFLIVGAPVVTAAIWTAWWWTLPEVLGSVFEVIGLKG